MRLDKQVPDGTELFLDHVGWFAPDLDAAALQFERLGFVLTPYSVHRDRDSITGEMRLVGSANRLVMLPLGYLEILSTVEDADTPVSRHMRESLAKYTGVHLVAFTVADAEDAANRQRDAGFDMMATTNLRRHIEAEDGSEVEVAFTVTRAQLGSVPEGRLQTLTHHTPEPMWQDRYIRNTNGIRALRGVVFATDNVAQSAERLSRYTGRSIANTSNGARIELDRGYLDVVDFATARQQYGHVPTPVPSVVALTFVGDPDTCAAHCKTVGIDVTRDEAQAIRIPPSEALGVALVVTADQT